MRGSGTMSERQLVTGDTLRQATRNSAAVLGPLVDRNWRKRAFRMTWTCRFTLDHVLNCLVWYAHDIAGEVTGLDGAARAGAPRASVTDLLSSLCPLSEVLALVCEGKPASARGLHSWGVADPEGFLAMGSIEVSLHTWDIVMALDPERANDAVAPEVAALLVPRLFPDAPRDPDPVVTLLYATGRAALGDRPRLTQWQWHSTPVD